MILASTMNLTGCIDTMRTVVIISIRIHFGSSLSTSPQSRQSSNQSHSHGDEGDEGREGCRPPEGDEGHEEVNVGVPVGGGARRMNGGTPKLDSAGWEEGNS